MKKTKDTNHIGVAWYHRDQWERLREVSTDVDKLEDTYEEWLSVANKTIKDMTAVGMSIGKVHIDIERLILWCEENGLEMNSSSRARYTAERLREIDQNRDIWQA
jgi:catechol-2,3-dioxygenase